MPCAVGSLAFDSGDLQNWIAVKFLGLHMSYLSKPTVRLAPDSYLMPVQLCFRISPPFASDLDIAGTIGGEEGMPISFHLHNSCEKVKRAYKGIVNAKVLGCLNDEVIRRFPSQVPGLGEDEEVDFHSADADVLSP
jgi:hypothetical protein